MIGTSDGVFQVFSGGCGKVFWKLNRYQIVDLYDDPRLLGDETDLIERKVDEICFLCFQHDTLRIHYYWCYFKTAKLPKEGVVLMRCAKGYPASYF